MDVNDLKGLYAEVNKRMNTSLEHVKHELAGVRSGWRSLYNGLVGGCAGVGVGGGRGSPPR